MTESRTVEADPTRFSHTTGRSRIPERRWSESAGRAARQGSAGPHACEPAWTVLQ